MRRDSPASTLNSAPLPGRESEDMGSPVDQDEERDEIFPPPERQTPRIKLPVSKFNQFWFWALMVICGQFLVLMTGLTFYFPILLKNTPMAQGLAEWAKETPRSMAFCVTIVATMLSTLSTFLFSQSLILFVTSHSNRPATLIKFITLASLSRRAPFFSLHHLRWAILSLITLLILSSVTAGFTSLITPTSMIVNVPIKGTEGTLLGMTNSLLMGEDNIVKYLPKITPAQERLNEQIGAVWGSLPLTAAYSAALRYIGFPALLNYLGATFDSTTGGVVTAIPFEHEALAANPTFEPSLQFGDAKFHFDFEPSNFKPSKNLPFNYTTQQQGFTVDVTCQALPVDPKPQDLGIKSQLVKNVTLRNDYTGSMWRYLFQCPYPTSNSTIFYNESTDSFLLCKICPINAFKANQHGSQLLILGGFGPEYSFISIRACQFTPYITLSEVQYSNIVNVSRVISRDPLTPATESLANSVYHQLEEQLTTPVDNMTIGNQNIPNKIADDIRALYGMTSHFDHIDEQLLNHILEHYFRGYIEAWTTMLKTPPNTIHSANSTIVNVADIASLQHISPESVHIFKGYWSYETLGWHPTKDSMGTTVFSIIPILLVTLTSIFLTIMSLRSLKHTRYLSEKPFDPNNLVTLLKAGRDGSVAECLGEGDDLGGITSKNNIKIQLHRNSTQWELRPVINHSSSSALTQVHNSFSSSTVNPSTVKPFRSNKGGFI